MMTSKWKVGIFSIVGLALIGYLSIYVNNHPYWWRKCVPVTVTVEDATGLKPRIPVKSLGLEVGFIEDVFLFGSGVRIKICVTGPVEVTSETRAYVRSEGFLGDRFLELRPMKYLGKQAPVEPAIPEEKDDAAAPVVPSVPPPPLHKKTSFRILNFLFPTAHAETASKDVPVADKAADVQQVMNEIRQLTSSLKDAIKPDEIRSTVQQLNKTLENASKIIAPEGSLSSTAKRALLKLEDAIDQFRDQVTKINQGEGSVGKILNDPVYADELKKALENINKFLNRASDIRLNVMMGVQQLDAHQGSRGVFQLGIWPKVDRYYLIGLATDPRGRISQITTTTQISGQTNTVQSTQVERGGLAITAMIGRVFFQRLDLSMGMLYGDGAVSAAINLAWWGEQVDALQWKNDLYFRNRAEVGNWNVVPDFRSYLIFQPFSIFYAEAGIEGLRKVGGKASYLYGAGFRFDDDDIKLLFSFL